MGILINRFHGKRHDPPPLDPPRGPALRRHPITAGDCADLGGGGVVKISTFLGAGMLASALEAASRAEFDLIGGGPSRADIETRRQLERARAERESWPTTPETRQQRRARERREAKRRDPNNGPDQ